MFAHARQVALSWRVSGGTGVLNATLPGAAEAHFARPHSCPSHVFTVTLAAGTVLSRSNEVRMRPRRASSRTQAITVLGGGAYQFQC